MNPELIEQDIHPERPQPMAAEPAPARANPRSVALCVGLSVAAIDVFAVLQLGLPLLDVLAFSLLAAALSISGILMNQQPPRPREDEGKIAWIIASIVLCAGGLAGSLLVAPGLAAIGAAALATGVCIAYWGKQACIRWSGSLLLLVFSLPWLDADGGYAGLPWRSLLAEAVGRAGALVTQPVEIQSTTVTAGSLKLAIASDAGGFWQMQLFLLAAIALSARRPWGLFRRAGWAVLALLLGAAAYAAFLIAYFVLRVVAASDIPVAGAAVMELLCWGAAFLFLMKLASIRRGPHAAAASAPRSESMFPEEGIR